MNLHSDIDSNVDALAVLRMHCVNYPGQHGLIVSTMCERETSFTQDVSINARALSSCNTSDGKACDVAHTLCAADGKSSLHICTIQKMCGCNRVLREMHE
jgi:hypothetical protein